MNIGSFETNQKKEQNGIWKDIGKNTRLLVARDQNPKYIALFRKKLAPYNSAIQIDTVSDDESKKILCEVVAETILLDWDGLTEFVGEGKDRKEVEVKYSKEKALEWLIKYPEFYNLVVSISRDVKNYKDSIIEDTKQKIKKQ